MKIIISPAKRLDFESEPRFDSCTQARFTDESQQLIDILRQKSVEEIRQLMKLSADLAQLNHERYALWNLPFTTENAKQAGFAFEGDVFKAMDKDNLNRKQWDYLQDNLRILSGLHGLLRPYDLIQPHRLEGGTKLETPKGKNLYEFWGNKITDALNSDFGTQDPNILFNLASNEYFRYIKKKQLKANIITANFKEYKNGTLKTVAIYAKKARGMMLNFMATNNIQKPEDTLAFNRDGYEYSEKHSSEKEYMFVR
ncbi:MAG: peroxide stress protein YaaA [Bacteroidota bacterium]|nr:peroxide stress protein YaaA [Bacteroidota bacterium]